MNHQVFVSYSQPDRDCAFEITARLEAHGIPVWIAPRDVSPAADWPAEIIDAITSARVMVLVFSGASNESPQVSREVERAVHKQLRILPFRIEEVLPSKTLEYFLSGKHWLDAFPGPRAAHYDRLCAYLDSALAAPAGTATGNFIRPPIPAAETPAMAVESNGSDASKPSAATDPAAPQNARSPISPDTVAQLEAEFIRWIGPVGRHLVRKVAGRATETGQLVLWLAAELDSETDRRQFTDSCRRRGWTAS